MQAARDRAGPLEGRQRPGRRDSKAARQLLSGCCLQYCTALRAVSDLYAADGGPLYGRPYNGLLPYMTAERQPGEPKGQEALSCYGLHSSIQLWDSSLALEVLRPMRPRHLLALCLRTSRVALASLQEAEAVPQRQQQPWRGQQQDQRQVGRGMDDATGCNLGGASVGEGRLGGVRQALMGPVELQRRLEAKECPELVVAAMELARRLVLTTVGKVGGPDGANAVGGDGSICNSGAAGMGCSGSSSSSSGRGDGGGSEGTVGSGGGGAGGTRGSAGRPCGEQPRAWVRRLLRDPSWADGWRRLALGTVRAVLEQNSGRQQQQQQWEQWEQRQDDEKQEALQGNTGLRCASLLLPRHADALSSRGGCHDWGRAQCPQSGCG